MTAADFRRIALGLKDATEGAHMGHPDFRVGGRIFATLQPDDRWGMVSLTPHQQAAFMRDEPAMFKPANGAWGQQGGTLVSLTVSSDDVVGEAMTLAWRNALEKGPTRSKARRR